MSDVTYDTKKITVRGTVYTVRELKAGEYDECLSAATKADDDIDTVLLAKVMALKAVEPKLSERALADLPLRVWRAINRTINEIHYANEDVGDPDSGNDSPQTSGSSGS